MASAFREVIEFFDAIGLYDVVLPFLLIFTIVFAILEKTLVLGKDGDHSKKNLNAMASFVIAFLVIASSRLVEIITKVSSQAVILLFLSFLFLLLVGSFQKPGEEAYLKGWWKYVFMFIMFLGIGGIFLNAVEDENGQTWLEKLLDFFGGRSSDVVIGSIVMLSIVVLFIVFILRDPKWDEDKEGNK